MKAIFHALDSHSKYRDRLKESSKREPSGRLKRKSALMGFPSFTRELCAYPQGELLRSHPTSRNLVGMLSEKEWRKLETELREQKRTESENSLFLENLFNESVSLRNR